MGKHDCPICSKSANRIASNKTGSVQCSLCSLWYHPPCAKVEEGTLDLINKCVDSGLGSPWSCTICETGLAKVAKDVKQNTARIGNVEKKTDSLETEVEQLKVEIQEMKQKNKALEDKFVTVSEKSSENSGDQVLQEVTDRASRERNLVMHSCPESIAAVEETAKGDDLKGIKDLFDQLGLGDINVDRALLGWRRLGRKEDGKSRPLLLIFKHREDRDRLLDRAPRLSKNTDEYYRNISIVPDLTMKQRKMEQEMFKKAEQQNLSRSREEVSKNLVSKVLGRRGERVLRLVEMRQDEIIYEQARVVRRGSEGTEFGEERGHKRQHSPAGNTPPARRGWAGGQGTGTPASPSRRVVRFGAQRQVSRERSVEEAE